MFSVGRGGPAQVLTCTWSCCTTESASRPQAVPAVITTGVSDRRSATAPSRGGTFGGTGVFRVMGRVAVAADEAAKAKERT